MFESKQGKLIAFVLCGVGLLVLPLLLQPFGNAWMRIVDMALLYVMLALGLIEGIGAGYLGDLTGGVLGSQYSDIFAFIVLILVLTVRPSGLLGERVADRA